jgi:outer membrane protein TolC
VIRASVSRWAVVAIGAIASFPSAARAADGGHALTADEVASRARATSFDGRARDEERAAAEAGVAQALAAYYPRLTLSARYTRLSSIEQGSLGSLVAAPGLPPGPLAPSTRIDQLVAVPLSFPVILDQYVTQATLQVPLSDYLLRIPQAHAAATRDARAAELSASAARLKAATDGRLAYYAWVRARLQADVAARALEQARAHMADVQTGAQAGVASKADVLRVTSQVSAAELLVVRARSLSQLAEEQVRTAVHESDPRPYQVGENVEADPPPLAGVGDLTVLAPLWSEALDRRLELRALRESEAARLLQGKAALAAGLPRLDAVAGAVYANPNQRMIPQRDEFNGSWDVGVQLSWTPTDLPGAAAARRAARARAAQLAAQQGAVADGIRLEVTQAAQSLRDSATAITSATRGLAAAEESYRVRRVLFQNGRATSVELTDADTELTRARLEVINARIDARTARARLVHALGRDI